MRTRFALLLAGALVAAAPAAAQDNAAANVDATATTADPALANATDPALAAPVDNAIAADPAATAVPADPMVEDDAYAEPAEDRDGGRFPWGLLGLLGLLGFLGRKRDDDRRAR